MNFLAPFFFLGWLALTARHPALGLAIGVVIVVWPLIKWAVRFWLEAFILSKGVKASHVLRDIQPRETTKRGRFRE